MIINKEILYINIIFIIYKRHETRYFKREYNTIAGKIKFKECLIKAT